MHRWLAWAPAVLLILAACGGGTKMVAGPASSLPVTTASSSTTTPPPANTSGAVKYYTCSSLLSDQEVRQATGLSNAAFFNEEKGEAIKGQTYCQFFAGSVSIAVSIATGPAFDQAFQPLMAAGKGLPAISGLGDEALWSDQGASLGVRVGSIGLTIIFTDTGGGSLGIGDPKGAAIAMAKLVLSRL